MIMLSDELTLLDAQLEAKNLFLQNQFKRTVPNYRLKQWEEDNGCFLTQEMVEIYKWSDGLMADEDGFCESEDMCFAPYHLFASFSLATSGTMSQVEFERLRRLYDEWGILHKDEIVTFVRPLLHLDAGGISRSGHIWLPCTRIRHRQVPFVIGTPDSAHDLSPECFYADNWQSLLRLIRALLESDNFDMRYGMFSPKDYKAAMRLNRQFNPLCARLNVEMWNRDYQRPEALGKIGLTSEMPNRASKRRFSVAPRGCGC